MARMLLRGNAASPFVPEINGLRAFAVVSVLLFHAFPTYLPGGYIGVDIFFVISGFVIARSYLSRLVSGETSLRQFFVKRIRRLAPAYLLLLLVVAPIALWVLDPVYLIAFGDSLLSQLVYAQNLVFWHQGDYFQGAWTKPLLHTWSLAVEEQFYLVFAFLILLTRRFNKALLPLLAIGFLVSLLGGYLLTFISPRTAFFWLPFRAWEFIVGIGAFLLCTQLVRRTGGRLTVLLAVISAIGLCIAVTLPDATSTFPDFYTGLAVICTATLLVLFDTRPIPIFKALHNASVQRLGEYSYSLYLWHWPLISFAIIATGAPLSVPLASAVLVVTLVLSATSYHLLEEPIRRRKRLASPISLLQGYTIAATGIAAAAIFFLVSEGGLYRYTEPEQKLYTAAATLSNNRCPRAWRLVNPGREFCPINQTAKLGNEPGLLILGDSHAAQLHTALGEIGDKRQVSVFLTTRFCDLNEYGQRRVCSHEILKKIIQQAQHAGIQRILAVTKWPRKGLQTESMESEIELILAAGMDLHISEVVPNSYSFDPHWRALEIQKGHSAFPDYRLEDYARDNATINKVLSQLEQRHKPRVEVLRPSTILCHTRICTFASEGKPNYADSNHLSEVGVTTLLPLYSQSLDLLDSQLAKR